MESVLSENGFFLQRSFLGRFKVLELEQSAKLFFEEQPRNEWKSLSTHNITKLRGIAEERLVRL